MHERDDNILRHIGRYRVSMRPIIAHRYFTDGNCDHVIQRLLEEERIKSYSGLPGGLSYYQLTRQEALRLQVPTNRCHPHRARSLREALAVLWFCCMTGKNRRRLDRKEIAKVFGRGRGLGMPHCAELDKEGVIYRVYAPGPNSRNDYRIRTLREECRIVMEHPRMAPWALARTFRFAILVETPGRLERMRTLLEKQGPWPIQIHLELIPGVGELANKFRELRQQ
jgi:hypothetical protein